MGLPRGIRIRGGRFHVDVSNKEKGLRYTGTYDTLEEAKSKQAEFKAALLSGEAVPAPRPAKRGWELSEAMTRTFAVAWAGSKSERHMRVMSGRLFAYWGKTRLLSTITTDDLDQWVVTLKTAGKSDGTINRYLAALSKLFTVAMERPQSSGITAKPKFPRRKEYNGRVRFLTKDEESRALNTLVQWGAEEAHDAVVVLLDTGMRAGELFKLEARDVNLATNVVTIWGAKNDEARSVPLTIRARVILEARASAFKAGAIFPSGYWSLRTTWERLRSTMGLRDDKQFVLHALRHTFCSRLVQRGVGLPVVMKLAGHKSLQVTMRYSHLVDKNLNDAIAKLELVQ